VPARRGLLFVVFIAALVATSIGSVLLPLGLSASHDSLFVGIALNVWAVVLAPSSVFIALVFPPGFARTNFHLVVAVGFVFNILTWTGVLYGIGRVMAKVRRPPTHTRTGPASHARAGDPNASGSSPAADGPLVGGPGGTGIRAGAVALASWLAVGRLSAQCAPSKLLRIVNQDISPNIPAGSFASRPKTVYRLGKSYARVEEAEDRERHVHLLIVVNAPDNWMANFADGTGRHVIDPDPNPKVSAPILNPGMFSGSIPPELLMLELGCEVAFFQDKKSPTTVLKTPGGDKIKQAVGVGDFMLVLLRGSASGTPEMLFLFRKDEIVFVLKYLSYDEAAEPDMKLFAKPDGIKFEESGPA